MAECLLDCNMESQKGQQAQNVVKLSREVERTMRQESDFCFRYFVFTLSTMDQDRVQVLARRFSL